MSRKSKSDPRLIWVLALLLGLAVGGYFLFYSGSKPFRSVQELDPSLYATSASSLRDNTYKVHAIVDNMLAVSPSSGRLISIQVKGTSATLPLLVTKEFNSVNIQKGQNYIVLVQVGEKGLLRTKDITKP